MCGKLVLKSSVPESNIHSGNHLVKSFCITEEYFLTTGYEFSKNNIEYMFDFLFVFLQIWDKNTLECVKVLTGHTGSVLCLQYDENVTVTGSSDSTVRYDLSCF